MSILSLIFPLVLGIVGVCYAGSPETRAGLLGVTAGSVVSLILLLSIYNLTAFESLLRHEKALFLVQGLYFTLLCSAPFALVGWAKKVLANFRKG